MIETQVHYPSPLLQLVVPAVLTLLGLVFAGLLAYRDRKLGPRQKTVAYRSGQLLAVGSALVTAALLIVFLFYNPYGQGQQPTVWTFSRMIHLLFAAAIAGLGGLHGRRSWLVAAFAIGFFPWWVGLYLLGTPGIFKWIPISLFGYLAAASLIGRAPGAGGATR